jgi:hypothetical protein
MGWRSCVGVATPGWSLGAGEPCALPSRDRHRWGCLCSYLSRQHVDGCLGRYRHGHRHASMAQAIADCQVLLCRGMGYGAYQSMQQFGIVPVVTDEADIEAAVQAYIEGRLQDHPERLH